MAQLKKKYVKNDAIDGLKLLLLNNQPLRALNASGSAEDMIKFDENGVMQLLKLPQVPSDPSAENDVVRKSFLDSEIAAEVSNRESAITAVETAYQAADSLLSGRLDVVEGDDSTEGSIAKAKKDAQEYADGLISGLINGAPGVLDTLKELSDALGGDENFATTIATQISGLDGRLDVVAECRFGTRGRIAQRISNQPVCARFQLGCGFLQRGNRLGHEIKCCVIVANNRRKVLVLLVRLGRNVLL